VHAGSHSRCSRFCASLNLGLAAIDLPCEAAVDVVEIFLNGVRIGPAAGTAYRRIGKDAAAHQVGIPRREPCRDPCAHGVAEHDGRLKTERLDHSRRIVSVVVRGVTEPSVPSRRCRRNMASTCSRNSATGPGKSFGSLPTTERDNRRSRTSLCAPSVAMVSVTATGQKKEGRLRGPLVVAAVPKLPADPPCHATKRKASPCRAAPFPPPPPSRVFSVARWFQARSPRPRVAPQGCAPC
jgi:hypothetical protein